MAVCPYQIHDSVPDAFLNVLYEHYMQWLVEPFAHPALHKIPPLPKDLAADYRPPPEGQVDDDIVIEDWAARSKEWPLIGREPAVWKSSKALICGLLSALVPNHAYRIKYVFLRTRLLQQVTRLLYYPDRFIVCST